MQGRGMAMNRVLGSVAAKAETADIIERQQKAKAAKAKRADGHLAKRPHSDITTAQILEARALFEFAGWKNKVIAKHLGLDLEAVKRMTSGRTGARLFATIEHLPAGVEPLAEFRGRK